MAAPSAENRLVAKMRQVAVRREHRRGDLGRPGGVVVVELGPQVLDAGLAFDHFLEPLHALLHGRNARLGGVHEHRSLAADQLDQRLPRTPAALDVVRGDPGNADVRVVHDRVDEHDGDPGVLRLLKRPGQGSSLGRRDEDGIRLLRHHRFDDRDLLRGVELAGPLDGVVHSELFRGCRSSAVHRDVELVPRDSLDQDDVQRLLSAVRCLVTVATRLPRGRPRPPGPARPVSSS